MPQTQTDPQKDLWMQTALNMSAILFPPLTPITMAAKFVDVDKVVHVMIGLKDVVVGIVHNVQQIAISLETNFQVCENKRLTGIVSCVALATSGLGFIAALTATAVPPATIVGIPSTIVTGVAFGASVVAVINNIMALNACLADEVTKANKQAADNKNEAEHARQLADFQRRLEKNEREIQDSKRRYDALIEQLKHAHH